MSDLKCMYCAEMGITNTDVFIEIVDVELGAGWICKECFIESEKEKDEHLKEIEQKLTAKEQECEELKEARKNSRCAWKSLEGTFCPQAQEQLEAYKTEAEEGKEINAELKAENDELKKQLKPLQDKYFKGLDTIAIAGLAKLILQKISECEGNDEN